MIALDTNVVVRFLVDDDAGQAERARKLLETNPVFVAASVLLETEWVLRSGYGFAAVEIARFLRALLGLENVTVAEPAVLAGAIAAYEGGLDFADALHLAQSARADAFATFDAKLIKRARRLQAMALIAP